MPILNTENCKAGLFTTKTDGMNARPIKVHEKNIHHLEKLLRSIKLPECSSDKIRIQPLVMIF